MHCVSSIKIGVLGQHSSAQLLRNLSAALPHIVKNIRENWDNVQSIHIKTSSSASLPIWTCGLDEEEGGRWDGLTRVPIPDNMDEEVTKGEKRALESEGGPVKKKKRSDTVTKKTAPVSHSRPESSPAESAPSKEPNSALSVTSVEPSNATKERPVARSSKKPPSAEEPKKVKAKPVRAAAVDFFDLEGPEGRFSPSKPSKTAVSRKSAESRPSPDDPAPKKSKSQGKKASETKSILKSPKRDDKFPMVGLPAEEKHVKFAAKPSNSKTKRDKALGLTGKKVRSGGGKGVSVKDGVLGKKVAVK